MAVEFVAIGIAIVAAILIARSRPGQARRALEFLIAIRALLFGIFLLVFALVLIFTGIIWMVLFGAVLLFLVVLFVLIVREGGDLRSVTEIIRSWI